MMKTHRDSRWLVRVDGEPVLGLYGLRWWHARERAASLLDVARSRLFVTLLAEVAAPSPRSSADAP